MQTVQRSQAGGKKKLLFCSNGNGGAPAAEAILNRYGAHVGKRDGGLLEEAAFLLASPCHGCGGAA